jgi:hypothetical protein
MDRDFSSQKPLVEMTMTKPYRLAQDIASIHAPGYNARLSVVADLSANNANET